MSNTAKNRLVEAAKAAWVLIKEQLDNMDDENPGIIEEIIDELISCARNVEACHEWGSGRLSAESDLKEQREKVIALIEEMGHRINRAENKLKQFENPHHENKGV